MTTETYPLRLMRAAWALSLGFALHAYAAEPEAVEEIVVTGSRIVQQDLTAISPVATVTQEAIQMTGTTRIENLLNAMPQVAADFGGNESNGATGSSTINLRGLGAQRTLVLVNSRRLMAGDPTQNGNSTPDLNQIPAALVKRVEILTGGASAVYGADAVAGVVNFIMMDDFEGAKFDIQTSGFQHNNDDNYIQKVVGAQGYALPNSDVTDGNGTDMTFVMGMNTEDGTGNATLYLGYSKLAAVKQSARDYSACALNSDVSFADGGCGGSSTASPARFQQVEQSGDAIGAELASSIPMTPRGLDSALRPYDGTADAYNYAPLNYYQRPDKRYTAGVFAHLDMSDHATVYGEFQFMDDKSDAQVAPSGAFRGSNGPYQNGAWAINCDNPLLTPSEVDYFCTQQGFSGSQDALVSIARRATEGAGRTNELEHTSYRGVFGVKGDIDDHWSYDVYGQYGTTNFQNSYFNDYSSTRIGKALQAVTDSNGNVVCRANVDADPGNNDPLCVPWNIFVENGVTPEAIAYVSVPGFENGETNETVVSAYVNGDLTDYGLKLPWANEGLAISVGAEYREERSKLNNDIEFATNDLTGLGGAVLDTSGHFYVREGFIEARLPLVSDAPWAKEASFDTGYRYSDYSLGFNTDTYKYGADWMPIEDIRLRGSYQRAVRAPNIQELFRPQVVQLDGSSDPCAVDDPLAPLPANFPTFAECANTGVTAAQYGTIASNPAGQYNGLTGGNPDLQPEKADTYTFGIVLTPTRFTGFTMSVDYFDIKIDEVINGVGADLAVNTCLVSGDPQFCSLVHRAPGGSLWLGQNGYVIDTNQNLGSLQTKGVDIEVSNTVELPRGLGNLVLNVMATYVDELTTEPLPGFPKYDCVGLFGNVCGIPLPEWRHVSRLTWNTPWNLDLAFTWRFFDNVNNENTVNNSNFSFGNFTNTDKGIDAQNYYDIAAQYQLDTRFTNLTFRTGVNNILDTDPPLFGQDIASPVYVNGNTYPQAYDALGRYWFLSVTAKL